MSNFLKLVNVIQNAREREYPQINSENCIGCGTCKKTCHHEAITGQIKKAHTIDPQKCFRCYHCIEKCPKRAICISGPVSSPECRTAQDNR